MHCPWITLTIVLLILISRGSSMRHSVCNGFYLFTIKFRIHDSVHPLSRSWNSSSDVSIARHISFLQIGWTEAFIVSRAHTFIHTFITRYKFTLNCVYLNIIMFLNNILYTFQHYFSCIFEELARFDVSRVYHGTSQCGFWTLYQSRDRSPALYHLHKTYLQYPSNFRVSRYERSTIV